VLSILDLGIVRAIKWNDDELEIVITPTYSGCPAMDMIAMNIRLALIEHGYQKVKITTILSPAWTTDWMSEAGKAKIKSLRYSTPEPHTNGL
jgi:ring-1,2-phenylacetyl-CoA epoxidase subunit PaaD